MPVHDKFHEQTCAHISGGYETLTKPA